MAATVLVISDLHLADGDPVLENWGAEQQRAFASMVAATLPGGTLASATVELVINGDCFDFLLAHPQLALRDQTDVDVALAKWAGIAAAHAPWFAALRQFLSSPNRRLTFLIGNHDLELAFPAIRASVRAAIGAPGDAVRFCLTPAYRPFPDVTIDHGCQFDPWNRIPTLWRHAAYASAPEQLETADAPGMVGPLDLPWGSRYFYRVFLPAKQRYPYLDALIPSLSFMRQCALLCLLVPDLVRANAPALQSLLREPCPALQAFVEDDVRDPSTLFFGMLVAMQQLVAEIVGVDAASGSGAAQEAETLMHALQLGDRAAALKTILTRGAASGVTSDEITLAAGLAALRDDPSQRLLILGHTHEEGRWHLPTGQALLNCGSWFPRLALPRAEEWTPHLGSWAEHPQEAYPGRDGRRFTIAWLRAEPNAATVGELIAWQGASFVPVPDDAMEQW